MSSALKKFSLSVAVLAGLLAFAASPAVAVNMRTFDHDFGGGTGIGPAKTAVDQATGAVYVIDTANQVLRKYDADGAPADFASLGAPTLSHSGVSNDSDVAVNATGMPGTDGDILVAAPGNVSVYGRDGALKFPLVVAGDICGAAIDSAGNLYVQDYNSGVSKFSAAGAPLGTVPISNTCDIAVDAAGHIYANRYGGSIDELDAAGNLIQTLDPNPSESVSVDPVSGRILVAHADHVDEWTNTGTPQLFASFAGDQGAFSYEGVAANGTSGKVYVSDNGNGKVNIYNAPVTLPDADLTLGLVGSADTVGRGEFLTYTAHVTNNGPTPSADTLVSFQLPSELTFDAATSDPSCADGGGGLVTCHTGALAPAGQIDIVLGAQATTVATFGTSVTATAAGTDTGDPSPGDATASVTTTIKPVSDLTLVRTATPNPVIAGQNVTVTYGVTNNGGDDAENTVLTEQLPVGGFDRIHAGSSADCTINASALLTCTFGTLPSGASASRTVVLMADPSVVPSADTTATVASDSLDPNPADNSVNSTLTVRPASDLELAMHIFHDAPSGETPVSGDEIRFTLTVRNGGPNDATGIGVTNTLPPGLVFKPAASDPSCSERNGTVTCPIEDLERFDFAEVTIAADTTGRAIYTDDLTNFATVDGANFDPRQSNNVASHHIPLNLSADISVSATASAPEVTAGDQVVYAVQAHANGPNHSESVNFRYPLPAGATFDAADSSDGCSLAGGLVTCNVGRVWVDAPRTRRIAIVTSPSSPATIESIFTVVQHDSIFDANTSNDSTSVVTTVKPRPAAPILNPPAARPPVPPARGGKKVKPSKKAKKRRAKKRRSAGR